MAERELWFATGGPLLYDDEEIATLWYPPPYDTLAIRAALFSQAYVTDDPVYELEIANKKYVDSIVAGTVLFELNATGDIQPKAKSSGYYNIVPRATLSGTLGTALLVWADIFSNALTIGSLTGLLKGTNGLVEVAIVGTDYLGFSGLSKISVGVDAPVDPGVGDLWVDTS